MITPMTRTDVETRAITAQCQMDRENRPEYRTGRLYDRISGDDDHCHHRKKHRVAAEGRRHRTVNRPEIDTIPHRGGDKHYKKTVNCS